MARPMPGKLLIVVVLMSIGVMLNLFTGAILSAVIGGALVLGVLVGNDGVRKFLIGLAGVNILWSLIVLLGASGKIEGSVLVIAGVFAIAIPAFMIWTLTQEDVREWMFRKNFHLDDNDQPPQL
jgi:hypothetical protein